MPPIGSGSCIVMSVDICISCFLSSTILCEYPEALILQAQLNDAQPRAVVMKFVIILRPLAPGAEPLTIALPTLLASMGRKAHRFFPEVGVQALKGGSNFLCNLCC